MGWDHCLSPENEIVTNFINLSIAVIPFRTLTTSYLFAKNYELRVTRLTPYKTRQGLSCGMKIQRNSKELN
jgi:hypothetical protein